jgi:hypothetical protein
VNWQHFQTFLWLRWRLRLNQLKRGGLANAIILAILTVLLVFGSVFLFAGSLLVGLFALGDVSPLVLLLVWDGLIVVFLFFWCTGLLSELQRSEALSLNKFLHLPVSLTGAFLINYISSLFSVNLALFVPAMLGLALGLVFSRGAAMLWQLPLLAAFVLMVTGVTYQFQGWLAALMVNKRRRRTIIVVASMIFIVICQLPNMVNVIRPWEGAEREHKKDLDRQLQEQQELNKALAAKQIKPDEYQKRLEEMRRDRKAHDQESNRQTWEAVERTAWLINVVLPPAWLALGASAVAEGGTWTALLGLAGMSLIGGASLWRSYRTTMRLYTGQFTSGGKESVVVAPAAQTPLPAGNPLEKRLPWLSEQAAVIALAGFRSLLRAPEAKMLLLTPLLLLVIFGSMFWARNAEMPVAVRPLVALGAMAMILFSLMQLIGNQFGFDRGGFRVFVLCPAPRADVLLGKNLALAPVALGLGGMAAVAVEAVYPMRFDHLLALLPQFVTMYLLFCMLANLLSILAPMPVAAGSLKPANPKGVILLLHMLFFFLTPLVVVPVMAPLGLEFLLEELDSLHGVPLALLVVLLEGVAVVYLYRFVLRWEGRLLQSQEQKILGTVTTREE